MKKFKGSVKAGLKARDRHNHNDECRTACNRTEEMLEATAEAQYKISRKEKIKICQKILDFLGYYRCGKHTRLIRFIKMLKKLEELNNK